MRAPATGRARRELLLCLCGLVLGVPGPLAGLFIPIWGVRLLHQHGALRWARWALPEAVVIAAVLLVAKGAARRLGRAWRARAARLLNESFAPVPPPDAAGFSAALRDGPTWRAAEYLALPHDYCRA